MASVACINYCLAVVVLVTLWLAGIINVLAITSTTTTTANNNNNNSSQPPWFKRESEAIAAIPWWANMSRSTSHCNWDGIGCNEAGSVTSISCPGYPYNFDGEVGMDELNLPSFQNLQILYLYDCGLKGTIPYEIGMLSKLTRLHLSDNSLSGNLPSSLANLTSLTYLSIYNNSMNGSIPFEELGNLKNLSSLDLGSNLFSRTTRKKAYYCGPIPSSVGFLTQLTTLYLDGNRFTGSIPSKIGNLINLEYLNLGSNNFSGPIQGNLLSGFIPSEIQNLKKLRYFDLSGNQLNGSIPSEIGNLTNISFLHLGNNYFSGPIPSYVSFLTFLTHLDLSRNQLTGSIPFELVNLKMLEYLQLGDNYFSGLIPSTIGFLLQIRDQEPHRNRSCKLEMNGQNGDHSCNIEMKDQNKRISRVRQFIPIIVLPITISLTMWMILGAHRFFSWRKAVKNKSVSVTMKHGNICSIWNYDGTIAYEDIIRSTNDFDIEHYIGTGGYGSVYRAQLPSGKIVALKKLHRFEAEEPAFDKSFKNEVEVLSNIRHKNIVKLYGFCLHNRCMFLIYEYMERGSLFSALRDDAEAVELDWTKRVSVVKGIAHALSYMHHDCTPPIAHRDISSNNILLNSKQDAFVADFGAAILLSPDSSNQTVIAGTRGYIAPGD
ncbi:hypothetical protein LguiB_012811 [Lonicera macranthoides]